MKRILLAFMVALTICSLTANAQAQTTVLKDSIGKVKITVSKTKKDKLDASNTAVTVIGMDQADSDSMSIDTTDFQDSHGNASFSLDMDDDFPIGNFGNSIGKGILVAIIAIIAVFGLPVFILFIVFFFRYKNRKARYRLAEKALAAGQPLPDNFLKDIKSPDQRSLGIKNTFTGIGLFIFLWAITGEFGVGAVGLLVMFMGIGQWIIDYNRSKEKDSTTWMQSANHEKKQDKNVPTEGVERNNVGEKNDESK